MDITVSIPTDAEADASDAMGGDIAAALQLVVARATSQYRAAKAAAEAAAAVQESTAVSFGLDPAALTPPGPGGPGGRR